MKAINQRIYLPIYQKWTHYQAIPYDLQQLEEYQKIVFTGCLCQVLPEVAYS